MSLSLPSPIRVLIIEDNPVISKDAEMLISRQDGFVVVGSCATVQEGLILIRATKPDLLLLDINLTDGSGFDILEQFPTPSFNVVFLTAYVQHAIRAIKFGALDYLLKPLDETELEQALDKVLHSFSRPTPREHYTIAGQQWKQQTPVGRLVLNSQQYSLIVELTEIIYCHSHSGYTTFHLTDHRTVVTSHHLKWYEDILPNTIFLRPHQSYLVNNHFIYRFHRNGTLELKDGTEIPIAMRRRESIHEYLTQLK